MSLLVVLHLAFGWRVVVVDETTTISVIQAWAHTVGVCVVHVSESSGNQQQRKDVAQKKKLDTLLVYTRGDILGPKVAHCLLLLLR